MENCKRSKNSNSPTLETSVSELNAKNKKQWTRMAIRHIWWKSDTACQQKHLISTLKHSAERWESRGVDLGLFCSPCTCQWIDHILLCILKHSRDKCKLPLAIFWKLKLLKQPSQRWDRNLTKGLWWENFSVTMRKTRQVIQKKITSGYCCQ